MRKVTGNEALDVPKFLTRACGVMLVPESTVPVGATIWVTPTSATGAARTKTVPDSVSLAGATSLARAAVQRLTKVPSCVAVQLAKDTSVDSPAARLVTVWVLV